MSAEKTPVVTRVTSHDGTGIGYFTSGDGPPLLLVHGSLGDHSRWDILRPHLEPYFTVHAMDRRGRGASGDSAHYSIEREYEDVAAVIDHIAAASGTEIHVYCSSFGGLCTIGAAQLTSNIKSLALYEAWPSTVPGALSDSPEILAEVEAMLAEGRREAALELAYRRVVGLNDDEIDVLKRQPSWPARVAAAHTMPREGRAFAKAPFEPEKVSRITVPTLIITGSDSPDWNTQGETVVKTFPNARLEVLPGQGHGADMFAPELVASTLLPFLREQT